MTALDVKHAKQALAWRLREWGTDDADARAAGFIDDLVSRGWQMSPERETRPRPPKPDQQCRTCGRALHHPDRVCDAPTSRPAPAAPPPPTYLDARRNLGRGAEDETTETEGSAEA